MKPGDQILYQRRPHCRYRKATFVEEIDGAIHIIVDGQHRYVPRARVKAGV